MNKLFFKRIINSITGIMIFGVIIVSFYSCELFSIDNYDEPGETLKGEIVDVVTGERVLTDQTNDGIRIRIRELSWKGGTGTPEDFTFYCKKDGEYQNTKVFAGRYNVRVDGPFIPLIRLNQSGDTIADESKYIDIKGITVQNFQVEPFLKVEWVGEPTVANGKITASFKVTRAVSPYDFRAKIEPMGGYSNDFLNVTDVWLYVSQGAYVGNAEYDGRYSIQRNFSGNSFEAELGNTITITTQGEIPAGYTMFIRAAARINYNTEGIRRYNYNVEKRVDIPK
ncbi:MAG: DUF3823 domain-containing protein [Tannerella sp.]|jgi:hypothetical protein|nr:DUF3823 domain-containing protein [Tannerella sp.]